MYLFASKGQMPNVLTAGCSQSLVLCRKSCLQLNIVANYKPVVFVTYIFCAK